jgi:hypothetical protein
MSYRQVINNTKKRLTVPGVAKLCFQTSSSRWTYPPCQREAKLVYATNEQSDVRCHCSRCPSLSLSTPHITLNEHFFKTIASHIHVVCSWLHFVDGNCVFLSTVTTLWRPRLLGNRGSIASTSWNISLFLSLDRPWDPPRCVSSGSCVLSGLGIKLNTHLSRLPRLRMRTAILPFPHTFPWRGA